MVGFPYLIYVYYESLEGTDPDDQHGSVEDPQSIVFPFFVGESPF